jgi:hypothetical protein
MATPARIAPWIVSLSLLGIAVTEATAAAARRRGGWSAPRTLATGLGERVLPTVAASGDRSVAAWESSSGLAAAVAGPGGNFGNTQTLTRRPIDNDAAQSAVINARGDAAVLFQAQSAKASPSAGPLYLSYRRPGGRFSAPQRLTGAVAGAQMAIDGSGTLTIVWETGSASSAAIYAMRRSPAGVDGAVQKLASGHIGLNALALNAAGQAVVTWQTTGVRPTLEAATRATPAGTFGAPVQVSGADADAVLSVAGIDRAGTALVVWDQPAAGSTAIEPSQILAATLPAGAGAISSVETVASPGSTNLSNYPDIALDENGAGRAIVSWQEYGPHSSTQLETARAQAGQAFGAPATITDSSCAGCSWTAAVGAAGQTVVSWDSQADPVQARVAASGTAAFGPVRKLAARRDETTAPEVAVNRRGEIENIFWNGRKHSLEYCHYAA